MDPKEMMNHIKKMASNTIKPSIPLVKYYRSSAEMLRQAKVYQNEGQILQAYVLNLRYVTMFLEEAQKHPEYGNVDKSEKIAVSKQLKSSIEVAEKLKPQVESLFQTAYEEHLKQVKLEEERRKQQEKEAPSAPILPEPSSFTSFYEDTSYQGRLREMYIPSSLINNFLTLAKKNTQNNIETCGLLTGTLQRDRLTITVLLIPQQTGSSDDCTAENDLATFEVIDKRGLLTLGWIHTHPTQRAFLSSVDLHSQFGYQAMMSEAIAIVCAPKYSNEVFKLTEMGLDMVGRCTQRGFHLHEGPQLFETAAHAQFVDMPCEVVDLRKPSW